MKQQKRLQVFLNFNFINSNIKVSLIYFELIILKHCIYKSFFNIILKKK